MSTTADDPGLTLGAWLAAQASKLIARKVAVLPWLVQLEPVLRRAASYPVASDSRWRRLEAQVPALRTAPAPSAAGWPRSQAAVEQPPAHQLPSLPPALQERLRLVAGLRAGQEPAEPGRPLPTDVRERLRPLVGPTAERLRVHQDEGADLLAREHGAAAVTVAQEIFFRRGQFRPRDPDGFALLAHEAAHAVEAMRPNSAWRRATTAGAAEEERVALAQESAVLEARSPGHRRAAPRATPRRPGRSPAPAEDPTAPPATPAAPVPAASPVVRPMTAPLHRELDRSAQRPAAERDHGGSPAGLYRDLRYQIRVEWERGG